MKWEYEAVAFIGLGNPEKKLNEILHEYSEAEWELAFIIGVEISNAMLIFKRPAKEE